MSRRRQRHVVAMALVVVVAWLTPAGHSAAKTTVTSDGGTVTLVVPIDLVGAINSAGTEVGIKNVDTGERTPISTLYGSAAKLWNDAFAKLQYKGCVNFKLDLQFIPKPFDSPVTAGHHRVELGFDPDLRPGVFIPGATDANADDTIPFTTDIGGTWPPVSADTVTHEVGHLLGLGDDYTDIKDANGKVTGSQPLPGRENTEMANSGSENIDQVLIDRIGKIVENSGQKLPKCWTGTMTSSSNDTVTASDGGLVCSVTWTTAMKFTVAADATLTGTATSTWDGAPVCTHPEFITNPMTSMLSTITGKATNTQLQIQLTVASEVPAGSIDYTGMSASLYGFNTPPTTITIPITTPGHAEGNQQLQTISGVNSYTSENAIVLDCQTC